LNSCKVKTEKDKIETARIFFQLKEEILTYTCENSLGLYYGQSQTFQMLSEDWQSFGKALMHSMADAFSSKDVAVPINA
jgi:hypothetical protein